MKKAVFTLAILTGAIALSLPVYAYETGNWIVRAGATTVAPDDSSSNVFVGGADLGVGVNVANDTQLGINIGYFVTPHISIEVLLATPFDHDIGLNTVGTLGSAKHLPPTLTANYYFADPAAVFQPYVGAGINYTVFFDEQFSAANKDAGFSDFSLDNSLGLSVQAGFDYMLFDQWHANASVRWMDIDTDAQFNLNGDKGTVAVDIDPFVYTLSVGYRF
ncbi:MAG: outer membrane protein [Paraglaciecola sp.]|jgi:outer membrane protein